MEFFDLLRTALDRPCVRLATGYRLRRGWLIPDVSATRPNQRVGEWFEGAPMSAIEIVSPGNSAEEIHRKRETYLEEGAAEFGSRIRSRIMDVFRKGNAIASRRQSLQMQRGVVLAAAAVLQLERNTIQRIVEAYRLTSRVTVAIDRHTHARRAAHDVEPGAETILRHNFHQAAGALQIVAIGNQSQIKDRPKPPSRPIEERR